MNRIAHRQPKLILIGGLPASGKTWFARALSETIAAVHINSDSTRAELGLRGQYDPAAKQKVYDSMWEKGRTTLAEGHTVVVDSTFYKRKLREPWEEIAGRLGVTSYFIKIEVSEEVAFNRLKEKREDSEADKEVYLKMKKQWEPVEIEHLTLDSGNMSISEMVGKATAYIQTPIKS